MPLFLQKIGITSEQEAAELERDLGVRFHDFTPEDCETWVLQTVYLEQYSKTGVVSLAADDAGVSIRTARRWQADNILGFNQRLEIAVLRYTDVIEVMLLRNAQEPKASSYLLMMLARVHMPEKYGSVRRDNTPQENNRCNHHCDHGPQPTNTSQHDKDLLEEIFRDLQALKQLAGLSEPVPASVEPDLNLSPTDPTSVGAGLKPAYDPMPTEEETHAGGDPTDTDQSPVRAGPKPAPTPQNPDPNLSPSGGDTQRGAAPQNPEPSARNPSGLNRRQRRELQRQAKRKHQNSRRARAPN